MVPVEAHILVGSLIPPLVNVNISRMVVALVTVTGLEHYSNALIHAVTLKYM